MKLPRILIGVIFALSLALPANAAMIGGHGQVTLFKAIPEVDFPAGSSGLATVTVSQDTETLTFNNGHAHISIRIGGNDYRRTFSLQNIGGFDVWVGVGPEPTPINEDLVVFANILLSEARLQAQLDLKERAERRGISPIRIIPNIII